MDAIMTFLGGTAGSWLLGLLGFAGLGALLDYLLKKYVTEGKLDAIHDFIAYWIAAPGDWLGLAINAGGEKLPFIGKAWNKTIEPWVIIVLRTVFGGIVDGFRGLLSNIIKALQSDNPSTR